MTYLLDVSVMMALLWKRHEHHVRATDWQDQAAGLAVCPLTELGFLRISTQPVFGASVGEAQKMLKDWKQACKPAFVACDVAALETAPPPGTARTTDFYLASLAEKHGLQLATLDEQIGHHSVFVLPP